MVNTFKNYDDNKIDNLYLVCAIKIPLKFCDRNVIKLMNYYNFLNFFWDPQWGCEYEDKKYFQGHRIDLYLHNCEHS